MKHALLLMACTMLLGVAAAQPSTREKIRAQKIAFITSRLDLSPQEAQQFWPVYNEYEKNLAKVKRQKKTLRDKNISKAGTADIETLIDKEMELIEREAAIKKAYHARFKEVLSVRKVYLLYRSEEAFKRELLKRLTESRKTD